MSSFRRDQIPFMASCFVNFIWSFSSFLSVDMIKLYSYQFMHDVNYTSLFYGVFAISFLLLIFLKFNKVFTTVMIIWFNFIVHILLVFFMYFPIKNHILFLVLFGIWSHLYALNLISSLYLSSYNLGGLHGLIMGTMLSYCLGYFLQHAVDHPSEFNIASRKATCNWFIAIRFIVSVVSFKFYRDYLEFFFYFEYQDSVRRTSMTDMFKWVDGKAVEIMSSVRIAELMPSSIDYACIRRLFNEDLLSTVYLALVYCSFLTTSFFSPLFSPTPLVLSIFVRNEVYFVEFLGGLLGVITALLTKRYLIKRVLSLYVIHCGFASMLYMGFNTKVMGIYKNKNLLYGLSFFSSSIGTFVLIYSFINFVLLNSIVTCANQIRKGGSSEECYVCCKNDTTTCLCYNKNLNETCGYKRDEEVKDAKVTCVNIWAPWNNHSTYRDWTYSDCGFCLSQNYNNTKTSCTCRPQESEGSSPATIHCCTCSCSTCGGSKECGCSCDGDTPCEDKCCCKKDGAVNYMLRNCVVSCCPYCDMCMLLECVKVPCVCACSHKNHHPRNAVEDEETDNNTVSLTKIMLNFNLAPGKHVYLCTFADSPDTEKIQKLLCCCEGRKCTGQDCCVKCCRTCKLMDKPCGKHFDIADCKVSSCCHYDLKIWISARELNSTFHIGQKPFMNKYDQINSLVFTNYFCRNCCSKTTCCEKEQCVQCKPVDIVKIVEGPDLSQSGGTIKLKCRPKPGTQCRCCCCCGENTDCVCSCSSNQCNICDCVEKNCRSIKVLPTNLPYQFREIDIRRNEVIAALGFAVVIFCLVKLLVALAFSLINQTHSLRVNFVVGDFTSVNKVTIKTFPVADVLSDKQYALERVTDYKGEEEFLINYAVDLEMKELEERTRSIKEMMDELNSLKFDRWLEQVIKTPEQIMPVSYSKLKFYRHINAYIDHALALHAFKTADRIYVYFDKFPGRWDLEWSDFERRFLQNLKVYTNYSLSLNSVGYFDTNTEFQKLINNRQSLILSHLNTKNDQLTEYLAKNRKLEEIFRTSQSFRKLPKYIDLWEFRVNLIKSWASENSLFLNWTPFVVSMERILLWNKLYRKLYMREYKQKYEEEKKEKK